MDQGKKIKQLFVERDLTITEVAEKIGYKRTTLQTELGKAAVSREVLDLLKKHCGITLDDEIDYKTKYYELVEKMSVLQQEYISALKESGLRKGGSDKT